MSAYRLSYFCNVYVICIYILLLYHYIGTQPTNTAIHTYINVYTIAAVAAAAAVNAAEVRTAIALDPKTATIAATAAAAAAAATACNLRTRSGPGHTRYRLWHVVAVLC